MTKAPTIRRHPHHRRRGSALVEVAMSIPLIGFILGMTFFFGRSLVNQQHVKISDRYSSWRTAMTKAEVSSGQLKARFFARRASNVELETGTGPTGTLESFVEGIGLTSQAAQLLADRLVRDELPYGQSAHVAAEFPSDVGLWNTLKLTGAIHSRHAREGSSWHYYDVSYDNILVEEYLISLDTELSSLLNDPNNAAAGGLVTAVRDLYLADW